MKKMYAAVLAAAMLTVSAGFNAQAAQSIEGGVCQWIWCYCYRGWQSGEE